MTQCPGCHSPPARSLRCLTDFSQAFPPTDLTGSKLSPHGGLWQPVGSFVVLCRVCACLTEVTQRSTSGRSRCVPLTSPVAPTLSKPSSACLPASSDQSSGGTLLTALTSMQTRSESATSQVRGTWLRSLPSSHSPRNVLAPAPRLVPVSSGGNLLLESLC